MTWPSIDHSLLSPNGKVSKRARKAALERARRELFGNGWEPPQAAKPDEIEAMKQSAQDLRDLAKRGMRPRAHLKKAEEIERAISDMYKKREKARTSPEMCIETGHIGDMSDEHTNSHDVGKSTPMTPPGKGGR